MNTEKLFSAPQASERQIRDHYRSQGCECRISDGHVRFRPANRNKRDTGAWREGRWVAEYLVVDGQVVLV